MTWPSQCPGSASAQMFKFNLDPQGDNSGLRGWDCCIQLAEVSLYGPSGAYISLGSGTVTNPEGNSPAGELPVHAYDGETPSLVCPANCNHKWLDFNYGDLVMDFGSQVSVQSYDWMTANDAPNRDPTKWTLESSDDGAAWTVQDNANAVSAFEPTDARYTWQVCWREHS